MGTETVLGPRVPITVKILSPFFCIFGAFVDCHTVVRALRKEISSNKI